MANIAGWVSHPDNPDAGAFAFDDGTQSTWMLDPGGKVRAETSEIVSKLMGPQALTKPQEYTNATAKLAMGPGAAQIQPRGAITEPNPMAGAVAGPGGGDAFGAPAPALPTGAPLNPVEKAALAPTPAQAAALQQPAAPVPSVPPAPAGTTAPAPNTRGLVRSGANLGSSVGTTGLSQEDRTKVEEANRTAQESQKAADEAAAEAKTQQVNAEWTRLTAEEKTGLAKTAALEDKQKQFDGKVTEHMKALKAISDRPIDPSKAFAGDAGWYSLMAGFGDSLQNFGAALAGRGPVANPGATIERIIQRNVALQTEQKEIDYKNGLITKEQLDADRGHVRINLATAYEQLAKTRLSRAKTEEEKLALPAMVKHAAAMRDKAASDTALALATHETRQETMQEEFAQPKPVGPGTFIPTDAESRDLAALLGPKWEESYEKGMNSKVVAGENGASVQQALPMIHEMDQDLATLNALKAANGGTIPTKGIINVPEALQGPLSKMGYKPGMAAEETGQMVTGYVLRKARSYGGAVTAPDYENAEKEFGKSGDGFVRGIERMRSSVANGTRQALVTHFRGNAQRVLDISMGAYGRTGGVPKPDIEEFEVQGAPHRDPDTMTEAEKEERRQRTPDAYRRGIPKPKPKEDEGEEVVRSYGDPNTGYGR